MPQLNWFVVRREDGSARITDDLSILILDPGEVVYKGSTIRSCRIWIDCHSMQEAVEEPADNLQLDTVIKELREAGLDEHQIVRAVVARGLLMPEG